jgi:hypothetical protein
MPEHVISVNGVIANSGDVTLPLPLVYVAKMTQNGGDVPTVTIFQNTIGDIVWTKSAPGVYLGTLAGAFPAARTMCPPFSTPYSFIGLFNETLFDYAYNVAPIANETDYIQVNVVSAAGSSTELSVALPNDSILIEIRVYPAA